MRGTSKILRVGKASQEVTTAASVKWCAALAADRVDIEVNSNTRQRVKLEAEHTTMLKVKPLRGTFTGLAPWDCKVVSTCVGKSGVSPGSTLHSAHCQPASMEGELLGSEKMLRKEAMAE